MSHMLKDASPDNMALLTKVLDDCLHNKGQTFNPQVAHNPFDPNFTFKIISSAYSTYTSDMIHRIMNTYQDSSVKRHPVKCELNASPKDGEPHIVFHGPNGTVLNVVLSNDLLWKRLKRRKVVPEAASAYPMPQPMQPDRLFLSPQQIDQYRVAFGDIESRRLFGLRALEYSYIPVEPPTPEPARRSATEMLLAQNDEIYQIASQERMRQARLRLEHDLEVMGAPSFYIPEPINTDELNTEPGRIITYRGPPPVYTPAGNSDDQE